MKKNNIDDKVGRTMKCMMIGSSFYNVALLIIVIISTIIYCKINNITNAKTSTYLIKNILIVLIGYVYSLFAIYSMTVSVTKSVDANDDAFAKHLLPSDDLPHLL